MGFMTGVREMVKRKLMIVNVESDEEKEIDI